MTTIVVYARPYYKDLPTSAHAVSVSVEQFTIDTTAQKLCSIVIEMRGPGRYWDGRNRP